MRPLTPSQTIGPFLLIGVSDAFGAELCPVDAPRAMRLHGSVFDGAGEGVSDAVVELWQDGVGFARSDTRDGGRFAFVVLEPDRGWFEVGVFARGLLQRVATRMYFPGKTADPVLSSIDPARGATLVAVAEPDGSLRFDIRLQGEGETVFFGP